MWVIHPVAVITNMRPRMGMHSFLVLSH